MLSQGTSDDLAIIKHDTVMIIDVNDRACELFRLDRQDLMDQKLIHGVHSSDMQWLTQLRLKTIREKGDLGPQHLPFMRSDGSKFWAEVQTRKTGEDEYETTLKYLYEY